MMLYGFLLGDTGRAGAGEWERDALPLRELKKRVARSLRRQAAGRFTIDDHLAKTTIFERHQVHNWQHYRTVRTLALMLCYRRLANRNGAVRNWQLIINQGSHSGLGGFIVCFVACLAR